MSELVSESDRYTRIISQSVGLHAHVDHHPTCIWLAGRRIDERHCNRFIRGIFLDADEQGSNTQPKSQSQEGEGEVPGDFLDWKHFYFSCSSHVILRR